MFAVSFLQALPEPVEALRPASAFAPLLQRTRSRQRSRFLLQHVEIVLQIEHLLIATETALVPRHALPLLPDLDIGRQQFRLRTRARLQRRRVEVRAHLHAALAIHRRKTGLRQLESFRRQRQQMLAFDPHRLADRHRLACDPPLFVLLAATAQLFVQLFQVLHLRNRHQMVAAEVTHFAFHSALLVASRRVAELRLKAPVRAESDQALRLFPLMTAQNLLHRALQVVVAQATGRRRRSSQTPTRALPEMPAAWRDSRPRETLRRWPSSASQKCKPASFAREVGHGFVPIHLRLAAPVVDLRHERLPPRESQLLLAFPHITAHRRFRHRVRALLPNPLPDPMCRVPLFTRRRLILAQNLVDELHHRTQPRLVSHRQFALRRNRTYQGLSHHPPMHAQLLRDRTNRPRSMRMLPSDLFE